MISTSTEDLLAIEAATAGPDQALQAWVQLMSHTPFDEISENTQRLVPAIFYNLRHVPQLPERERLRGAFKYAWSRNIEMQRDLRPVLQMLNDKGLNYRVIKGVAIQLRCGATGSRIMGDIDLLVSEGDFKEVLNAMTSSGFRRNTYSVCDRHVSPITPDSANFNRGKCHVDVHIAELKAPAPLLLAMLKQGPSVLRIAGVPVKVPPVELLLLHAAVHGGLNSGPTDFAQAAMDTRNLIALAHNEALLYQAKRTRTLRYLLMMLRAANLQDNKISELAFAPHVRLAEQWEGIVSTGTSSRKVAKDVIRKLRIRRNESRELSIRALSFDIRLFLYSRWLSLGRFALAERIICKFLGGFLPRPSRTWQIDHERGPRLLMGNQDLVASTPCKVRIDRRFKINFAGPTDKIYLTVHSKAFEKFDSFLFVDGHPRGRIVAEDPSTRSFFFRKVTENPEFSLRPLWETCEACYEELDDLAIEFDYASKKLS